MKYHFEILYIRELQKAPEGVVSIVKVTSESKGYDGFMGICIGHYSLSPVHTELRTKASDDNENLLQYLQKVAQSEDGSNMTANEILAVWSSKKNPEKTPAVVHCSDDSQTTMSALSISQSPVAVSCCSSRTLNPV